MNRITTLIWLLLLGGALAFLVWRSASSVARVRHVSDLPGRAVFDAEVATSSATGYPNGQRELILPARNEDSFHWIRQTQEMIERREWRVSRVDYDNAPFGREVHTPSPYRWWLGMIALFDHFFSGRTIGLSVERAALVADSILYGLLLLGSTIVVAWRFGSRAAAIMTVGWAVTFPLVDSFFPGLPDSRLLTLGLVCASILALVIGVSVLYREGENTPKSKAVSWFFVAGFLGGGGIWLSVSTGFPVVIGVGVGALIAAGLARRDQAGSSPIIPPWRVWALGGATSILLAYCMDYFPSRAGLWKLEYIHPLYGSAWLGLGELLHRLGGRIQRRDWQWQFNDCVVLTVALLTVVSLPVTMHLTKSAGFLSRDLNWLRLAHGPEGIVASSLGEWVAREGFALVVIATLSPLLFVLSTLGLLFTVKLQATQRMAIGLMLGPLAVAGCFACMQLSWWSVFDVLALVLLGVVAANREPRSINLNPWIWLIPAAVWMVIGVIRLLPKSNPSGEYVLTSVEAELLIERDVAHWLARRSNFESSIVYAPPNESTTLAFYGGLRGIGTYALDNDAAVEATLKIAGSGSVQEAQLLLQGRGVRYLVLPSWDSFFQDYARLYQNNNDARWGEFFFSALREWHLPPWLRPVPYGTPVIAGLDRQTVQVFEVVTEQSPAVAAARLSECLVAIGENDRAAQSVGALRKFPSDVGALAAEAQVMFALGDTAGFERTTVLLLQRLKTGADRYLPWDRRVSLAIVLARAKQTDLARAQIKQCVVGFDEAKAGALSAGALFNFLQLVRGYGFEIQNVAARTWSLQLLPPDLRARLL